MIWPNPHAALLLIAALGFSALAACGDDGSTEDPSGSADVAVDTSQDATTRADAGGDGGDRGGAPCSPMPEECAAFATEGPGRLSEHAAAALREGRSVLVFGGTTAVPRDCGFPASEYIAQSWLYDVGCGGWRSIDSAGPSARGRHMMASSGTAAWLFGGRWRASGATSGRYTLYGDLWRFDAETQQWTEHPTVGPAPRPRVNGALVWDESRGRLWLVGGNASPSGASYEPLMDVWSIAPEDDAWQQHETSGTAPSPRLFHTGLYDPDLDAIVIHGGADETAFSNDARYFTDLWSLDLETLTWTENDAGRVHPDGRFWGAMARDPALGIYVLFGGHDAGALGNRNDTWEYIPDQSRWAPAAEGDAFANPARGFCDFPPDFADVVPSLPERRDAHTFVWSERCERGVLFGGKTDCGAVDDVWEYVDGVWSERIAAQTGEACLRWRSNPENCENLCF